MSGLMVLCKPLTDVGRTHCRGPIPPREDGGRTADRVRRASCAAYNRVVTILAVGTNTQSTSESLLTTRATGVTRRTTPAVSCVRAWRSHGDDNTTPTHPARRRRPAP
jgi:hypothetical protein